MSETRSGMDRASLELEAAELLARHGFAAPAVSRAYYAAFYAAEEALSLLGVVRSKHSGVVAAVATILVRQYGLDAQAGRLLRSLFERRSRADYSIDDTPAEEATQALTDADIVVTAIRAWIVTQRERKE